MAYDAVEPIGERRLDRLFAFLMTLTANINRPEGKEALEVNDFLPDFWGDDAGSPSPEQQSLEEQRTIIEMMKLVFERSSQ